MSSKQVIEIILGGWEGFDPNFNRLTVIQVLFLLAAIAIFSLVLGRPTEIVDSALRENPPTGVIRVRFPSHSGLEEVEIFNRLLEPSGGMRSQPSQKDLQKGVDLESKEKGMDANCIKYIQKSCAESELNCV
jgi:hypothetical protein